MIICPNCGGQNPLGSRFCDQCAAPLSAAPGPGRATISMPPVPGSAPPVSGPPAAEQVPPATSVSESPSPAPPALAGVPSIPATTPPLQRAAPDAGIAPTPPQPAKRRDPALVLIGGAILALVVFLAVGVVALLFVNAPPAPPTPTPGAGGPSGGQATEVAQQTEQLHATQTALSQGIASAAARQTAAAQETTIAAAIQATGTALAQGLIARATASAPPPAATSLPTATPPAPPPSPTGTSPAPTPTLNFGFASPSPVDVPGEIQAYFTTFYQARTLLPGGHFDIPTITGITASPYRDYTVNLLQQNQADVDAGQLQQVTYSDIGMQVLNQETDPAGTLLALVELTRTMTEVRAGSTAVPQTGTYQFRLRRLASPVHGVLWQAYDFFNPATGKWISEGGN